VCAHNLHKSEKERRKKKEEKRRERRKKKKKREGGGVFGTPIEAEEPWMRLE
jgi:hypothetical protein